VLKKGGEDQLDGLCETRRIVGPHSNGEERNILHLVERRKATSNWI